MPESYFQDVLHRQAVVNRGVTFRLRVQRGGAFETTDYCYADGILDYVKELAGEDALTVPTFIETERRGRDRADKPEYKVKISAAFCFSNRVNDIEYYHNSSWLEYGGAPEKATKSAFTSAIDAYIKQQGKYQKSESKISFQDVQDCLILVTNCFSTITSYENQTKKAITNKFIQEAMTEFFRAQLEIYFIEHKTEADRVMEQVLINKRSRETAEKARLNIKKKLTGNVDLANRVQKFVDCRSKDVSRREIYIVEGNSALGACKLSRDAEFQGIMPVRGKILNCLKADYARIFKSDVITDLMRVLGCGVEVQSKQAKDLSAFNLENLRWNKVIICTDADVDGSHIEVLLLTLFYKHFSYLMETGHIYISMPPLFKVSVPNKGKKKERRIYCLNEEELKKTVEKLKKEKFTDAQIVISRFKGLGEMDWEELKETSLDPETRRLLPVKVGLPGDDLTGKAMQILMGNKEADARKQWIERHGDQFEPDI